VKRIRSARDGFALLAVLWMLGGGALLGALLVASTREAQRVAINRVALARARWLAEGCVERARAAVDEAVGELAIDDSAWARLDRIVRTSPVTRGCDVAATPVGITLDVNWADDVTLRRFFAGVGLTSEAADSLTAAILDWRDADDDSRTSGAESRWYERAGRVPPRNADFATAEELQSVRGLDRWPEIARMLGVERDRILLSHAPPPVLATLPGLSPAALAEIERRRMSGDSVIDVLRLAASLDSAGRARLLANLSALNELATALPDAWLLVGRATSGAPPLSARLELRVVRSGRRLAILRRRSDS
jgi:type II secretory pathway component PulK